MRKALQPLQNESGMVLVVAILIISALILLGSTAVMESTTDLRIAGNYKTHAMALYAAEAGIEEARARLRNTFSPSASRISDTDSTSGTWGVTMASLQSAMPYAVTISHATNNSGNVLYWGDVNLDGKYETSMTAPLDGHGPIYQIRSISTSSNASKTLVATVTKLPPITTPAALYVEAPTTIQGTSTYIKGIDSCGSDNKPGIATTLPVTPYNVGTNGSPTICGVGDTACIANSYSVVGNRPNMDVQEMVDSWKSQANYAYHFTANPPANQYQFGTPVLGASQQDPSSCAENNIVHFDLRGLFEAQFTGGSSGCGILLVEGDLRLNGGFNWYGIILVTGSITFAGGGSAGKNITGSVVAGGSAEADLVGGNTSIIYCSSAVNNQTQNRPLRYLSWTEG